jgi:hypothetical protein
MDEHGTRWSRMTWRAWRGLGLGTLLLLGLLLPGVAGAAGTIKCTPNNAPAGTAITVTMTQLPASEPVTLIAKGPSGVVSQQALTTGADGNLTANLNTTGNVPGDYTAQLLDKAGTELVLGRYTLTAAPGSLPETGGGFAARPAAPLAPALALAALLLLGSAAVALPRRR